MIRQPAPADMPRLLEMGKAFNEEAGYSDLVPFDAETFAFVVAALARAGLVLVVDKGDGPIGMAAADVSASLCNREILLAREAFWYVRPEHRDRTVGRELFGVLEKVVASRGVKFFDVVAEEGKRSTALARIYRAAGYSPAENPLRKVL